MHSPIIFLIGYMACGKTTLGQAVAKAYPDAFEFIDLDNAIEQAEGLSINAIFEKYGEAAFRRMEREHLHRLASLRPADGRRLIIGCGGGTPCQGDNLDFMLGAGTVVWLRASMERTVSRLIEFQATRPLLKGKSSEELKKFAETHIASRIPHYSRAHMVFDSSRLENAEEIQSSVEEFTKLSIVN